MITRCVLSQAINYNQKKPNKEKCLLFKSNVSLKNLKIYKNSKHSYAKSRENEVSWQNTVGQPFYTCFELRDFLTPCRAKRLGIKGRVLTCIIRQVIKYTIYYSTALLSLLLKVFSICYPDFRTRINLYPLGSKLVKPGYHTLTLDLFRPRTCFCPCW